MKQLHHILKNVEIIQVYGTLDLDVTSVEFDSRKVDRGGLFVAVTGTQTDGHQFIEKAIENGAIVIVCETLPVQLHDSITYLVVKSSSKALGYIACNWFENPSQKLQLVGVTGTNGKTTTVTLLYSLFKQLGYTCGLLSTVRNLIDDEEIPATHTTGDAMQINQLLSAMVEKGCSYAFMEVSSHAVDQNRIAGLQFAAGVFTNLTHDHLDYHKTFDAYLAAKKKFFDELPSTAYAIANTDDRNGRVMLQNTIAQTRTYSLKSLASFKCRMIENSFEGLHLQFNGIEGWFKLVGEFNAYNLLAIFATAVSLGQKPEEVVKVMSGLEPAEGRFYTIKSSEGKIAVVDYAHTPDALKNVLKTLQSIRKPGQRIITVFGAGGDRDPFKRPEMGAIAAAFSDKVVITSDNPRSENPETIMSQILQGIEIAIREKVISIENRREAIRTALALAQPGDIVLVAGKGHEKYQEIHGVKHPFDDVQIVKESFNIK